MQVPVFRKNLIDAHVAETGAFAYFYANFQNNPVMQNFDWNAIPKGFKKITGNRRFLEALAGAAIILVVSLLYFSTSFGEVLRQNDIMQGLANGQEAKAFYEETGEKTYWTNSLFSGMPTFQISPSYGSSKFISFVQSIYGAGLPSPANLLFMMTIGFYILLLAFGLRWHLALLGAFGYGFSSYFLIIIGAGHIWKFCALAYIPPTIAGIVLCYRGKLLAGGALTALFAMMQIVSNHVQMTYYFLFVVAALMIAYFVIAYRDKAVGQWAKATGVLFVAAVLAIGANSSSLYNTYEYSKETVRGKSSELTPLKPAEGPDSHNVNANGIDRDYITAWSYGVDETLTLLIPNVKGGATVKPNDVDDNGGLVAASVGDLPEAQEAIGNAVISDNPEENAALQPQLEATVGQFRQYFGDQPMTNGPVYVGALIFALFILGLFVVKGPVKWALLAVTVLSILLAWGHNFHQFTYWMIDHFPMYDKFRAPSSILVVVEFTMPLLAAMAVNQILSTPDFFSRHRRALYFSFGLPLLICVVAMLFPSIFGNGLSVNENEMLNEAASQTAGIEQTYVTTVMGIVADARLSMVAADALRSFVVLAIGLAAVWLYLSKRIRGNAFAIAMAAIVLIDLAAVDKRYLNADVFVPKSALPAATFEPTAADLQILQDTTNYRVMDVTNFGSAVPSYFHKSVGGYHAAKLTRYNDLIERQIDPAKNAMLNSIQTTGILYLPEGKMNALDMLNTKYLVFGSDFVAQNPGALGNAWFVGKISYVKTPDDEMNAVGRIDVANEAVADEKFRDVLGAAGKIAPNDTIYETLYCPNELHYKAVSQNGGLAVFSEIYFPWGWTATIDGKPADIGRVNYMLRALRVPSGTHDIVFRFDPQSIHVTENIAYASILLIYLGLVVAFVATLAKYGRKEDIYPL